TVSSTSPTTLPAPTRTSSRPRSSPSRISVYGPSRGRAFLIISATVTTAAGAHGQQLVLYYAASVFTRLPRRSAPDRPPRPRERRHKSLVTNLIRAIVSRSPCS